MKNKKINSIEHADVMTDPRRKYYWDRVKYEGRRYPKFHWPTVEMFLNVVLAYDILTTHFARRMAKYGLSISAFNILMILSRSEGKGCKQRDLSSLMLVSRANVTGLIDSLVRQGFVTRTASQKDRRVCIAKITKAGDDLLEQLLPWHYEEMSRVAADMSLQEKENLSRLLTRLRISFVKRLESEV